MKKLMTNIKWENVQCHICHSNKPPQPIKLYGQPLVDGQFGYAVHPVICECGLVFLNPRWSKDDYSVFYENYYDDLYRLETKPDYGIPGVIKNMKVIWNRIEEHVKGKVNNIMDVGCGSGYGLKYLKEQNPEASIYGIESSPECCATLQGKEVGATLITTDFDSDWTNEYENQMDLIILRHVVEHMLYPVETLRKLRTVLTEHGFAYFAVPDMMHPRTSLRDYDNWWEYTFRSVHTHDYCKETFLKTLELAGLYPYECGEENGEVWCLASLHRTIPFEFSSVYAKQMEVLNELLPQS